MKFIKGMVVGSMLVAGVTMMYTDGMNMNMNKKKMMKKGKQFIKKMGII